MPRQLPFSRILHADWSKDAAKRWVASARRENNNWVVDAPHLVGDISSFLDDLFKEPEPTLTGFDFPIGLPHAYGAATNLTNFPSALEVFGTGAWSDFYRVAERSDEVTIHRPFYPQRPGTTSQSHLLAGLGVQTMNELRRHCELPTGSRRAAGSIFWTLGGNQVGKAAISGWREVIAPARKRGAKLWPFDGALASLVKSGKPVLAETYPAEAYGHVGVRFGTTGGKTSQSGRQEAVRNLGAWARNAAVTFSTDLQSAITDGFGPAKSGEDPFDALMGLLGMIEVADGRRSEGPPSVIGARWEGWILGQAE